MTERRTALAKQNESLEPYCYRCGDKHDEDATPEDVDRDDDGYPLCRHCYHELYEFECHLCAESVPKSNDCDDGSDVFAMLEEVDGHQSGLYRVLRRPYLLIALVGGGAFFDGAVQRIAPLPSDAPAAGERDYTCGCVCLDCQRKHLGCVRHTPRPKKPRKQ